MVASYYRLSLLYRRQVAAMTEVGSSPDNEGLYKKMKRLNVE